MIGSLGCPYTCSFCIDSVVDYQPLAFDQIREDLRFLLSKLARPLVGWHDPELRRALRRLHGRDRGRRAAGPDALHRREQPVAALRAAPQAAQRQWLCRRCCRASNPGSTAATNRRPAAAGMEKVRQVSEHVNMILRYIPFVQTNFVLGLDSDEGREPFELTKRFIDMTPGAFPAFSLFTSYGRARRSTSSCSGPAGSAVPVPLPRQQPRHEHRPLNYEWPDFYDRASTSPAMP